MDAQAKRSSASTRLATRWPTYLWCAVAVAFVSSCAGPAHRTDPTRVVPPAAAKDGDPGGRTDPARSTPPAGAGSTDIPPPGIPTTYVAPTGWGGYPWGTPLTAIEKDHADLQLYNAQTVEWQGKTAGIDVYCGIVTRLGQCL